MSALAHFDVTGEGLFRLLYGRAGAGYAVLGLRRRVRGQAQWERHAFGVDDARRWTLAVETAVSQSLAMTIFPFVCGDGVLRGIGTAAFDPTKRANIRAWQSVVAIAWESTPTREVLSQWTAVGGHVITTSMESYGLLALEDARPLGALTSLTREVASELGARPLGYARSLPVPGVGKTAMVTDPAAALSHNGVTGDELARAGLRTFQLGGLL